MSEQGEVIRIRTLNIAHRGASSLAPENTTAAFDKALEIGADGLEFDVQMSKDQIPVIIHDHTLERTTTGHGPVKDLILTDLKSLDSGAWFAPQFSGLEILTLDEFFERYKYSTLLFDLELKNELNLYPGLEKTVLRSISEHNLENRIIISSFNQDSLLACSEINPDIRTGLIYRHEIEEPWHYALSLGCYSVHPLFFYLQSPETLSAFKRHNLPLYPWTVNDPELMKVFITENIEAIITDYPQTLKAILDDYNLPGEGQD